MTATVSTPTVGRLPNPRRSTEKRRQRTLTWVLAVISLFTVAPLIAVAVLALSPAARHPAIALAIAKTNFPDEPFLAATIVLYLLVVTVLAIPYVKWRRRSASPPLVDHD